MLSRMKPLVSILIPAYNAQQWIAETIESALQQTWSPKEIIVVDDGSTDQTLPVAQRFASKEVSVVTQQNQGAAAARNKAFALSQGDYIQWLDADDLLAPDKIARQMQAPDRCNSKRTLLSGAWGKFYYRKSRAKFRPTPLWCDLSPAEWLRRKMSQNCHMQTANWLVSRELTTAAGLWDTRLLGDDDGEYFCRVKLASDGIKFVPEARIYYRMTGNNRLSWIGQSNKKQEAQFLSMQLHISYLRSLEESERSRAACVNYLQKYMFDFHPERPDIVQQMQQLAATLGGRLELPRSSWKYALIQQVLGWPTAKWAQLILPQVKTSLMKSWDKTLFRLAERVNW
jgi:glycosyltransferase involved in cell wall biosynthesis